MTEAIIKFGTDGWRGQIAADFTFENVRICTQAAADYLHSAGLASNGIVIGYDTRFLSPEFARTCAEVMAGNGIRVGLTVEPTPTPVISYGIISRKAGAGIVVTASHNPRQWNGLKFKSRDGASAPVDAIETIEKYISSTRIEDVKSMPLPRASAEGLVETVDLFPAYSQHINRLIDLSELKKTGLSIQIDSMHGAGSGYLVRLLGGGNLQLCEINGEMNPDFPGMKQPEPIAANLKKLSETVIQGKKHVGVATDGDADRLGIVDENGVFLNQLQVYALLALYFLETRGERGAIVKTITSTSMLRRLGEIFTVPVFEVPVGFKYVAPVMLRENAIMGGEESGGFGFRGHVPERDGILAAIFFLDLMARTGKTPSALVEYLCQKVGYYYYDRRDVTFEPEEREKIMRRVTDAAPHIIDGSPVIKKEHTDGFRFLLEDGSWLLIRFSGTEPLLRIYTETDSRERVARLLSKGCELAGVPG